ncbi:MULTISPECIES: DUF1127 domain-containing protein [unclassified Epibacterium]|jgi:uncharacterized protein YjiS (DUF1127 family)|uniref:DUF1127 domain-containing protein n=1 Tax=unclassified Epibacterium TaxID=2639179 RepID=UPI001EF6FCE1|nr:MULTISPECIES: DUF1127 domain-containing protein [unclassified Epibacterium]MCG7624796.1 DUF1127 domain-containing protein [Epibacterium sp. Ofav1-8]MCG7628850.1 DUF1127 domain-containing protein [Epibacterium sp. MM17-32]
MAHALNSTVATPSVVARLRGLAENARTSWDLYKEYKRTYEELDALTDRDLADIGIRRCDIADLARTHVYGA